MPPVQPPYFRCRISQNARRKGWHQDAGLCCLVCSLKCATVVGHSHIGGPLCSRDVVWGRASMLSAEDPSFHHQPLLQIGTETLFSLKSWTPVANFEIRCTLFTKYKDVSFILYWVLQTPGTAYSKLLSGPRPVSGPPKSL